MTDVVWVTSSYPWVGDPVGGIFFRTQARALSRLGLDVTVAAVTPWAPWPLPRLRSSWRAYADAPRVERDADVSVIRPRYPSLPGQPSRAMPDRFMAASLWRARRRWRGARVVHGHYAVTGLAAWRVARRARLPLVLTFHGDDLNTWPDSHPERMADLVAAIRDAAAVIAVSDALADRVRALAGVDAVHLPIGCDHSAFVSSARGRPEARQRLRLPSAATIVLYVGYLLPEKGVRELVDAILLLGDPFMGVFVGGGREAGYGLQDAGDRERIRYVGQVDNALVAEYMAAADVLVLASYGEGLPTVLVEAGSMGLPVIASPVGGIPDLLAQDRGTLLQEATPEAIATALQAFTADRDGARGRAARLGAYVRDRYDVDKNAGVLADLYRSAAPRPPSR